MATQAEKITFYMLALDAKIHEHMMNLLRKRSYPVVEIAVLEDLLRSLKEENTAIVLLDSETMLAYGAATVSKIKMSCQDCKVILLCAQTHRDLIKPAMGLGTYGCIIEPYPEWELATIVRSILADMQPENREKAAKRKRPTRN